MYQIELELGKPNSGWLNTAIVIQKYHSLLSQNNVSYWCYLDKYDINLKVAKNTDGGARIKKAIDEGVTERDMQNLLLEIILPHLTPEQFINIIEQTHTDGFVAGKEALREAFNILLNGE